MTRIPQQWDERYSFEDKKQAHHIRGAPAQGEPACQPSNRLVSMRTGLIQRAGNVFYRWVFSPTGRTILG